jgi:hypothetical protein
MTKAEADVVAAKVMKAAITQPAGIPLTDTREPP